MYKNRCVKTIISITLFVLAALITLSCLEVKAAGPNVTYFPTEYTGVLNNPYMGFAPSAQWSYPQPHSLVYIKATWAELEPTKGNIDFNSLESKNRFNHWKSTGVKAIIRIVLDDPSDTAHKDIPDWLYQEINGDGTWYSIDSVQGFSPNYDNPILIQNHRNLISQLAARYHSDPFIAQIALGSIGHWGEFHTKRNDNLVIPFPMLSVVEQYVTHYMEFFPNKFLLMRRPHQIAKDNKMGLYNDVFGNSTSTKRWYDWTNLGYSFWLTGEAMPAMPDFWKYAPSGGELANSPGLQYLEDSTIDSTLAQIIYSHTSWLGPSCPAKQPLGCTIQNNIDTLLKTMGYRFVLQSETYPSSVAPGETLSVTMVWNNKGTAPFYLKWPFEISVSDSNGNIVTKRNTTQDIRLWLPGTKTITHGIGIPANIPEGTYKFCVAILDPSTGNPGINLAIEGKRMDGRYELGEFTVKAPQTPASTPTPTFINISHTPTPTSVTAPIHTLKPTPTPSSTPGMTPASTSTPTPAQTTTATPTPTISSTLIPGQTPSPQPDATSAIHASTLYPVATLVQNTPHPDFIDTTTRNSQNIEALILEIDSIHSNSLSSEQRADLLNSCYLEYESIIASTSSIDKLIAITKSYINSVVKLLYSEKLPVQDTLLIRKNILKTTKRFILQIGNHTLKPVSESDVHGMFFELNQKEFAAAVGKAKSVKASLESLLKDYEKSMIPVKLDNEMFLTLDLPQNTGKVNSVELRIPAGMIAELKNNGIKAINVSSHLVNFVIPLDCVKDSAIEFLQFGFEKTDTSQNTQIKISALTIVQGRANPVPAFENKIDIQIPYTLRTSDDPDLLTTLHQKSPSSQINIGGRFHFETNSFTFKAGCPGTFIIQNNNPHFSDIKKGHWAEKPVYALKSQGIISGKSSINTFKPNDSITRAEFAKLICLAFDLADENIRVPFNDVSPSAWYSSSISSAVKNNIFTGRPNGTFAPNEPMSRQDLAAVTTKVLSHILGLPTAADTSACAAFTDNGKISNYAKASVATNIKYNIMNGKQNNMFYPLSKTTRAEAAVIIYKLLNYVEVSY